MTTKIEWQREMRRDFVAEKGYSTGAHYATGGLRGEVLKRDDSSCVRCAMTDAAHKAKWGRPITIDHIDKDRSNNALANLQTLCLSCHGRKDQLPELREPRLVNHKAEVLSRRERGESFQAIADSLGFSVASIWKWCRVWGDQTDLRRQSARRA